MERGANASHDGHSEQAVLAAARALMVSAHHCALATLREDGQPAVRPMDPFPPDDDLRVWMATNPHTRKAAELARDPRATLHYLDRDSLGYVTLLGTARLVDDEARRRELWKPEWIEYYPGGPGGETFRLLEFVPRRVEVVSPLHGIADEPLAWKPAVVELSPPDS